MRPKSKFRYVSHDLWAVMERARAEVPMSALPPKADIGTQSWNVRFVPKADILRRSKIVLFMASHSNRRVGAQPEALKGSLDFRYPHLGFNRVGNETILMGGVMHLIELFRTGLSVVAPRNPWT